MMRRHRLDRLSKLTQGAALVSLGALAACNSNGDTKQVNAPAAQPTEPIHVNATPTPSASATPSAAASAAPTVAPPTINATAAPEKPAPSASVARPHLPRINAPPRPLDQPPPKE